jgi:hypothetical protein
MSRSFAVASASTPVRQPSISSDFFDCSARRYEISPRRMYASSLAGFSEIALPASPSAPSRSFFDK